MFIAIPTYPDYQFNPITFEVKSLARIIQRKNDKPFSVRERILNPNLSDGYYTFNLCNEGKIKTLYRHQISFLVKHNYLPKYPLQIDHIDGTRMNDHANNLQVLTYRENISKGFQQKGKSLPTGVTIQDKKYRAQIWIDKKRKHLGIFDTIIEASNIYQKELLKLEKG